MMKLFIAILTVLALANCASPAAASPQRSLLSRWNITCMLVFGDSTVDPGNNNRLRTTAKANFPPYGKDFFGGRPTGRFCDGRLATDLIANELGISKSVPAFLDPNLTSEQLIHGVSFASASSGYDELTSREANVLSFPKQINYLMHYKIHLSKLVGAIKAEQIIKNAIIVMSAGTNDFIENYYLQSNRSEQFTLSEYQDYLVTLVSKYIKQMHRLGAQRFVLAGVPPVGCLPVIETVFSLKDCYEAYNDVAISFNSKLRAELNVLMKLLPLRAAYLDIYHVISDVTKSPLKYGFKEISRGCCGSGTVEVGETCKGQSTCEDPSKYIYWDAVHPTERLYKIIADYASKEVIPKILG